jgi:transposase
MLPTEMGCGMSCWRRLGTWQEARVWARLHQVLLERLHAVSEIDRRRANLDSASVPAKGGSATDRGKSGTKRQLVTPGSSVRTHAWFNRLRRLPIRYERRADIYGAFSSLAASRITLNQIKRFC